jgi:hypothetical protein
VKRVRQAHGAVVVLLFQSYSTANLEYCRLPRSLDMDFSLPAISIIVRWNMEIMDHGPRWDVLAPATALACSHCKARRFMGRSIGRAFDLEPRCSKLKWLIRSLSWATCEMAHGGPVGCMSFAVSLPYPLRMFIVLHIVFVYGVCALAVLV